MLPSTTSVRCVISPTPPPEPRITTSGMTMATEPLYLQDAASPTVAPAQRNAAQV